MSSSYVEPPVRPLVREQMSFLMVINFVLRNLGLMLITGVLVTAILVFRVATAPQTYSSTSTFSIGDFGGGSRITSLLGGGTSFSNAGAAFITEIMTEPVILEPLAQRQFDFPTGRKTALEEYGGTQPPDRAIEAAMGALSSKMQTSIATTTGWISLTTTGDTPKLAEQLNYTALAQLDSFQADRRRKQSAEDRQFMEERLADLGAKVRAAENRLQAFQENNRDLTPPSVRFEQQRLTDSVATQKSLYSTILSSYERERIDATRQIKLLTVIAKPTVPHQPDRRPYVRTIVLGLFAGAFLATLIALVREYFGRVQKETSPESAEFMRLRERWIGWISRLMRRERTT
jgi:uncharacterized protein involved in exopolysaccharide biosynthesis